MEQKGIHSLREENLLNQDISSLLFHFSRLIKKLPGVKIKSPEPPLVFSYSL